MKRQFLIATSLLTCLAMTSQSFSMDAGIRPSFINGKEEASNKVELSPEVINASIAKSVAKSLSEQKLYKLDADTIKKLSEAYTTNKSIEDSVRAMNGTTSIVSRDPVMKDINESKLRLLAMLADIDPTNEHQLQSALGDQSQMSALDLMTFVSKISPLGLAPATKANMKKYLNKLEEVLQTESASDALRVTNAILINESGFEIDTSLIETAAQSTGGIAELFKTGDDMRDVEVHGEGGTPLKVTMTLKKAQEIEALAGEEAIMLIEMAKNPDVSKEFAQRGLKDLRNTKSNIETFIKGNPILDRQSEYSKKAKDDSGKVADSLDELLGQLQELGATVGGSGIRQKGSRFLRALPGGKMIVKDPIEWKRSIGKKVTEIDTVLVDGVKRLEDNNNALNGLKIKALDVMADLQVQMAKTKLIADHINWHAARLEKEGNQQLATIIRSEIVPRIQRELNTSVSLYAVLVGSVECLNEVVRMNNMVIESSIQLRIIAAPAIAVTESITEAGRDVERIMKQSKKISRFVEGQLVKMVEQIKTNNQLFAEHAGESTINPEVLDKMLSDLAKEKVDQQKRMADAGAKLAKSNDKLVATLSKAHSTLKQDSLGTAIDGMMKGSDNRN